MPSAWGTVDYTRIAARSANIERDRAMAAASQRTNRLEKTVAKKTVENSISKAESENDSGSMRDLERAALGRALVLDGLVAEIP